MSQDSTVLSQGGWQEDAVNGEVEREYEILKTVAKAFFIYFLSVPTSAE